ncbi:Phenylalanyl-tRNA synthetase beta chain [hydrothermal vent metagenome]|uniref:Phenylalanine--tRNA ligase beta subunit n=1 Tax=hydrothermal vent metagenome TaxID=652676 RepID=A0A3B0Z4F2_9ZZZZ
MKFSEAWLREWVNPNLETAQLAEQLTMAGLEVDSIEVAAGEFSGVVVAEVVSVEAHPDADKLRVCQVSTGEGDLLQIVCGASNVRAGMKAPLATVGGRIGEMKIKKAKLRGLPSHGMLCSAHELGLSEDKEGLMDLPADAPTGQEIREYLALDDVLIDIDLTPNRGDCLGLEGVAREVGALNGTDVSRPDIPPVPPNIDDTFPVDIKIPEACPRYLGRVIRGINPDAQTPLWMKEKLRRSGLRSLGPVVDVTNYVMLELGQPMHAFDLSQLSDGIEVRYPKAGESLTLLDERGIEPDKDTLLICDRDKPLALAGVMGGEHSGISANTRDLFLEVAFFTPEKIAGCARRYGLATESAYRFERGVDAGLQRRAMERATALLLELVGGEVGPINEVVSEKHLPQKDSILLRRARIKRLLGFVPDDAEVANILARLEISVESVDEGWSATPPGFRFDLGIEADLIEEVGRVFGYNQLPTANNSGDLKLQPVPETTTPLQRVKTMLVDRDYSEVISYSFVDAETQSILEPGIEAVALANPISSEMSVMRTSLWPGLAGVVKFNIARQQNRIRIFESGLKFIQQGNELKQKRVLSGAVVGDRCAEQWGAKPEAVDFFDVKGDLQSLLEYAGVDASFIAAEHPALHPGQSAAIYVENERVGWLGRVHPQVAQKLEIPGKTLLFEFELDVVLKGRVPSFEKLSRFPSIRRDLAVVVDAGISAGAMSDVIHAEAGPLLQDLRVFDVYEGKGIESGRKSIAFGLILQDSSRTLTDDDVDTVMTAITVQLEQGFGATLRE